MWACPKLLPQGSQSSLINISAIWIKRNAHCVCVCVCHLYGLVGGDEGQHEVKPRATGGRQQSSTSEKWTQRDVTQHFKMIRESHRAGDTTEYVLTVKSLACDCAFLCFASQWRLKSYKSFNPERRGRGDRRAGEENVDVSLRIRTVTWRIVSLIWHSGTVWSHDINDALLTHLRTRRTAVSHRLTRRTRTSKLQDASSLYRSMSN